MGDWEQKNLVNELTRGKELARKLEIHLMNNASTSSWLEAHEFLVQRIVASNEKALSMLNCATSIHLQDQEDSDAEQYPQDAFKKRRMNRLQFETHQVRVPRMGLQRPPDDGFSWRKYGQKESPNVKYPKSYYRCSNGSHQGCLAKKRVHQSDEDPTLFEITYNGRHTCTQVSHNNYVSSSTSPADQRQQPQTSNQQQQSSPVHTLSNSSAGQTFSSFHFVSSSSDVTAEAHEFLTTNPLTPENSGTNYFSVPEAEMDESGAVQQNLESYESSEIAETIPAATTSATSSPTFAAWDDFTSDSNFTFENSGDFK